jgi:hypothetical protein
LISALCIFNIIFWLASRKQKRKKKGLFISGKQNTKEGRAVSKNKTPAGADITFLETTQG